MIKIKNNYYRNLEEQVQFLTEYHNVNQGLVQWGIRVVGQVETSEDLPVPYDGEYGDAIAVGSEAPFFFYIWTRASIEGEPAYWFPFGEISIVGPEGPKGDKGDQGIQGPSSRWYAGLNAPTTIAGYNEGDMYLAANGQVFIFENNTWNSITNIKGDQGIQGIQGPKGDTGPIGPQGPKGEQGDVGGFINIAGIITDFDEYGNPILPTPSELNDLTKAYLVGTSTPYDLYVQIGSTSATATWNNAGPFNAATLVTSGGVGLNVFDADTKLNKEYPSGESVYIAQRDGTTNMVLVGTNSAAANTIARRTTGGQIFVTTPSASGHATTKKYVDDKLATKLTKETSTSNSTRVYGVNANGDNKLYIVASAPSGSTIVYRDSDGHASFATPNTGAHAANKEYVDNKITGIFSLDGTTLTITTA